MYLVILFGLSTLVHLVQPRSMYAGQLFGPSTAMFFVRYDGQYCCVLRFLAFN